MKIIDETNGKWKSQVNRSKYDIGGGYTLEALGQLMDGTSTRVLGWNGYRQTPQAGGLPDYVREYWSGGMLVDEVKVSADYSVSITFANGEHHNFNLAAR
jgi:hypothetical protein